MDEFENASSINVFFKPKCPVKVGDRFYRMNHEIRAGRRWPDKIEVVKVTESKEPGYFFVEGKYLQHTVGTNRTFSSMIFKDPDWVIERRGIDF